MIPARTALRFGARFLQRRAPTPRPLACSLLLTPRCNLDCLGCSYRETFGGTHDEPELDTAGMSRIIRALGRSGLPVLIMAGGEPMLRADLFTLAARARDAGMFTVLFTNATLIDRPGARRIRTLFHRCLVSVDGTEQDNDAVRGPGSYRLAAQGIRTLAAQRGRARVIAACVVNKWNVLRLGDYIEAMRELGVHGVKLQANFLPHMHPSPEDAAHGLAAVLAAKRAHPGFVMGSPGFFHSMADYFAGRHTGQCFAAHMGHIVISPSGKYSLCCYRPTELDTVAAPADLDRTTPAQRSALVRGCPGCHRYDEDVLHALFRGNLRHVRPRALAENLRI